MKPTHILEGIGELKRARTLDNALDMNRFYNKPVAINGRTLDGITAAAITLADAIALNSWGGGIHPGRVFDQQYRVPSYRTRDGVISRDPSGYRTVDSTGSFLVGELERLDLTMHMPLVQLTWSRDIDLREDVTIGDDVSSFTLSSFSSNSGLGSGAINAANGLQWIDKRASQIPSVSVDIAKIAYPLTAWGLEVHYTILELESAARLGRPIDTQKFEALKLQHQMSIDQMVYVGDNSISAYGLLNNPLVSSSGGFVGSVAIGAAGFSTWAKKTADEILADFSTALSTVWANSAWAVVPENVLIPPAQFAYIATTKVSNAGNVSILEYILENNLVAKRTGKKLSIEPCKWLQAAGGFAGLATALGNGGFDRMVVYTKNHDFIRYPMTLLQRTPVQFDSIWHKSTYFCKLGQIEPIYPETIGYFDGI